MMASNETIIEVSKKQALMGRLNKMCNIFAAALQPIIAVATKHSLPCWDKRRIVA